MKYLIVLLSLVCSVFAIPENHWRGNLLQWKPSYDRENFLDELKKLNYRGLIYHSGKLLLDGSGRMMKHVAAWDRDEEYWEKKLDFEHWMELDLEDSVVLALAQKQEWYQRELYRALFDELKFYQGKFKGVILRVNGDRISEELDLKSVAEKLKEVNFSLGVMTSLRALGVESRLWSSGFDFHLFNVKDEEEIKLIPHAVKYAVAINRPFYFHFDMAPEQFYQEHSFDPGDDFFAAAPLVKRETLNLTNYTRETYRMTQDFQWGEIKFSAGDQIVRKIKSLKALEEFLQTVNKVPSFWFSGNSLDLARMSPRVLFRPGFDFEAPEVVYEISEENRGLSLRLGLLNPNPVGSRGRKSAGVAVHTKGFKIRNLSLGDFDGFSAENNQEGDVLFFTMEDLGAFEEAGGLQIHLIPDERKKSAELRTMGWVKPETESHIYYYPKAASDRIPEYEIRHNSKLIWQQ
jgi:hypothetical protein